MLKEVARHCPQNLVAVILVLTEKFFSFRLDLQDPLIEPFVLRKNPIVIFFKHWNITSRAELAERIFIVFELQRVNMNEYKIDSCLL